MTYSLSTPAFTIHEDISDDIRERFNTCEHNAILIDCKRVEDPQRYKLFCSKCECFSRGPNREITRARFAAGEILAYESLL